MMTIVLKGKAGGNGCVDVADDDDRVERLAEQVV